MSATRRVFITLGPLLVMCLIFTQYRNAFLSEYPVTEKNATTPPKLKQILYWTPMFGESNFNLGLGKEIFKNCTYKNCYTTYERSLPVEEFDAILFHGPEYRHEIFGIPEKRDPKQIYVLSNQESPINTPRFMDEYSNFYNWTMTYRLDSDIVRPYGFFEKRETDYQLPSIEDILKKPKKIAWFVSNCVTFSEREKLYNELQKHIPVDIYGSCGELKCSKKSGTDCYDMMERDYKFYLSFENSVCKDYVTEKLYNILERNIVPIVYGGADYDSIAPPNSVINVMDFRSIEDLVQHIHDLDRNPEKYLRYLEWKKHYVSDTSSEPVLCTLCQKLNEPIEPKLYSDLATWWRGKKLDVCFSGFVRQFFNSLVLR